MASAFDGGVALVAIVEWHTRRRPFIGDTVAWTSYQFTRLRTAAPVGRPGWPATWSRRIVGCVEMSLSFAGPTRS